MISSNSSPSPPSSPVQQRWQYVSGYRAAVLKAAPDLQKLDEEAIRILPYFPLFSKMDGQLAQN